MDGWRAPLVVLALLSTSCGAREVPLLLRLDNEMNGACGVRTLLLPMRSVAVQIQRAEAGGDRCVELSWCMNVVDVGSIVDLQALIANAGPQPLLAVDRETADVVAVVGYHQSGCPAEAELDMCGETDLSGFQGGELTVSLKCDGPSNDRCPDPRPRDCGARP
jgi:hypothetical protein